MVQVADSDGVVAVDGVRRRNRDAALLNLGHQLGVQVVQELGTATARTPKPEVDDRQRPRRESLEPRLGANQILQIPRLRNVLVDHLTKTARAMRFQRKPQRQPAKRTRELRSTIAEDDR